MDQSDLSSVTVKDKGAHGTQSFTQVAAMLGSRSLPEEARLADVWASISEVSLWPLQSTTRPQLSVSRETHQVDANTLQAMVSGLPGNLQDHAGPQDREQAVHAWLADYPSLAGYRFRSTGAVPDSGPESWDAMQGTIGCRLVWDVVGGEDAVERRFEEIAPWKGRSLSGSTRVIHARFGGDDREIHPLLAWWAVLYTLSMLARYQPGQWTAQIDVNRSKDAVALEYLLDSALAAVPELILAAIDEVTT